jgi:hypothetical protein
MFQYTKETILNDVAGVKVVTGIDNPYTGEVNTKKLVIEGVGEYYLDAVEGNIVKTVGQKGKEGKWTIDVPEGTGERILSFRVVTPNQYLAEYASPNWNVFGKPIVVGFSKDADLVKSVQLAIPEGNKFIKVSGSGNSVVIEGSTPYINIDKVYVTDVESGVETEIEPDTEDRVEPFATKEWIIENLRFPTYPNIRYNTAGNVPTAELYAEYSFAYKMPRTGLGGLSGVGQTVESVTRHILYVPVISADGTTGLDAELAKFKAADTNVPTIDVEEDDAE